jgi:hypothetical protein
MTSTIITKNSSTASSVPSSGSLTQGELAVNVTDKKLYTKDSGGTVVKLVGSLGNQEANAAAITGGSINGTTVGASTASTGAFTTLSASSTVSGTGFSTYLASPPAIGGTAAAAGAFTTLAASGAVTLSGGTANGVAYLNGSKVVTSGSALTFDGANIIVNATTPAYFTGTSNLAQVSINRSPSTGSIFNASQSAAYLNIDGASGGSSFQFVVASAANTQPSEQMRLTSTGLGIGTSSPTAKLYVNANNATATAIFQDENNGAKIRLLANSINFDLGNNGTNAYLAVSGATSLAFNTNSTERMRLDSSGNLGLGVTPSAWSGFGKTMEFNNAGCYIGNSGATSMQVGANNYFNGTNYIYSTTNVATRYAQSAGSHLWFTAPSGTAGNAITFTQAMTLDASGRLCIGVTSASERVHISTSTTSSNAIAQFTNGTTGTGAGNGLYLGIDTSNDATMFNFYNSAIKFGTNATERARIDSSGNWIVGKTSANDTTGGLCYFGASKYLSLVRDNSAPLFINRLSTDGAVVEFARSTTLVGTISVTTTATAYNTSSDYRLKNTIAPMTGALAKVALLKPCTYKWNADGSDGEGFIAHELAEVVPQCVTGEKDAVDEDGNPKYQGIDTSFLVATLTAAIQEQQAIIESLKARLDAANL